MTSTQELFHSKKHKDLKELKRADNQQKTVDMIGLSNYPMIANLKVKGNLDMQEKSLQ